MKTYEGQYFKDVTEIRKNMTGLTGSGELVTSFETPQVSHDEFGSVDKFDIEIKQRFDDKIKLIVNTLNDLSSC